MIPEPFAMAVGTGKLSGSPPTLSPECSWSLEVTQRDFSQVKRVSMYLMEGKPFQTSYGQSDLTLESQGLVRVFQDSFQL